MCRLELEGIFNCCPTGTDEKSFGSCPVACNSASDLLVSEMCIALWTLNHPEYALCAKS